MAILFVAPTFFGSMVSGFGANMLTFSHLNDLRSVLRIVRFFERQYFIQSLVINFLEFGISFHSLAVLLSPFVEISCTKENGSFLTQIVDIQQVVLFYKFVSEYRKTSCFIAIFGIFGLPKLRCKKKHQKSHCRMLFNK